MRMILDRVCPQGTFKARSGRAAPCFLDNERSSLEVLYQHGRESVLVVGRTKRRLSRGGVTGYPDLEIGRDQESSFREVTTSN